MFKIGDKVRIKAEYQSHPAESERVYTVEDIDYVKIRYDISIIVPGFTFPLRSWVPAYMLEKIEEDTPDATNEELAELVKIAQKHIPELEKRVNLESLNSDREDFFETSVWSLKAALIAAYELGKNHGGKLRYECKK